MTDTPLQIVEKLISSLGREPSLDPEQAEAAFHLAAALERLGGSQGAQALAKQAKALQAELAGIVRGKHGEINAAAAARIAEIGRLAAHQIPPSKRVAHLPTGCEIGGGAHFMSVILADGTLRCWGQGSNYSNGDGSNANRYLPQTINFEGNVEPKLPFKQIAKGGQESWALDDDGNVWSWGGNNYGQLGHGDTKSRSRAKRIEYFADRNITITQIITPRYGHSSYGCVWFLSEGGQLYACGYNGVGQLGDGTTTSRQLPVPVSGMDDVRKLVISEQYRASVYAIDGRNRLWSWGSNNYGALGLGDASQRNAPSLSAENIAEAMPNSGYQYRTQYQFALIRKLDGTVWSCGNNASGQLGIGDTSNRTAWTQLSGDIDDAVALSCCAVNYGISAVLHGDKTVSLMGYNGNGGLGSGDTSNRNAPFKPDAPFQGKAVEVQLAGNEGAHGSVIVRDEDGALWGAGYDSYGQLGIGSFNGANKSFIRIGLPFPDKKIARFKTGNFSTSAHATFALLEDGRLLATGYSGYGELGTQTSGQHKIASYELVLI